jgi:hypothetical protein
VAAALLWLLGQRFLMQRFGVVDRYS